MNKKILILKLSSGEEIVGTVYTDSNEYLNTHDNGNLSLIHWADKQLGPYIIIHIPVQIIYAPGQGLGMLPFQHYTEKHSVIISMDNIVTIANPAQELLDGYTSKYLNGISLVTKPRLVI